MAAAALGKLRLSILYFSIIIIAITAQSPKKFSYNGFSGANFWLDGISNIHPNGLLELTNSSQQMEGHAFYPFPLKFSTHPSFSTTFVFAIYPQLMNISGHGLTFFLSPSMNFTAHTLANEYLGLFNYTSNGLSANHLFAVELDTIQSPLFGDINNNHVGIDINGLRSIAAASVGYYSDKESLNISLNLVSGKPMQIWIDYHAGKHMVDVAIAPLGFPKPSRLLLSTPVNLSATLLDTVYVGFSASTGTIASKHYILGWSFSQRGEAQALVLSKLPSLPPMQTSNKKFSVSNIILIVIVTSLLVTIIGVAYVIRRRKYREVLEDWEQEYALLRFSYKDLYKATKGFKDKELLGSGGFGKVFKGVMPSNDNQVAVKRVSYDSRQGMKEFVAEITSMSRVRHRNLVQFLGYCRTKGELLLVYDYMPNGSLDKFLFSREKPNLSWHQRFRIVRGVASAILYLHEDWEQVILHRDIKASNVLLDANMNARLGDFGLARLYDHGTNPQTTHVVGTVGYIAPELTRTGKATTSTDVFAFGIFILEVACGRRPIDQQYFEDKEHLVDWVFECWAKGEILEASDPRLEESYAAEEMELALKLGLLCSHTNPQARPSMRQVMQFLDRDAILPDIQPSDSQAFNQLFTSSTTSTSFPSTSSGLVSTNNLYSTTDSVLQTGRRMLLLVQFHLLILNSWSSSSSPPKTQSKKHQMLHHHSPIIFQGILKNNKSSS